MLGLHVPGSRFKAALAALSRSLGLIEFTLDGRVLTANENFCELIGYSLSEIKGKHHSLFVDPAYAASPDYKTFWLKLGRGEYDAGQYKRITKDGREIWIQASYNPVRGRRGTISKIIKQVTDITAEKLASAEFASISNAISRAQATIEFTPTGEVITANDHFLKVMGYQLEEIKGQSHRLFVDADYSSSQAYRDFWKKLAAGDYVAAEFKRISKDGREVWLQASYNPIFDINNKVTKVIKFATDVTDRVKAVNGVAVALQELAANNLMYRIIDQYPPEFEAVRLDFNLSLEKLEETMNSITSSTQSVHDGASEITQASDDLSKRTERQTVNLEETAAAMDQITSTVRKSAQNAQEALNVVRVAHAEAERSGAVVRETVSAMSSIDHSSKQIGNIIGVIDEIAFQTNLLALNAGVEAARAGDAGRGFAVVATEVRALAQRSADAAKEIKTLISESSRQVDTGVTLVAETGRALVSIAAQVTRLTGLIGDMASSGLEQATGLSHVNTSVNQLDQVTQQSAAMVEQATAASHSLEREAQELTRLIGQFRITRPSNSDLVDFRLDRAGSANGTQSRRIVGVRDPRASPL